MDSTPLPVLIGLMEFTRNDCSCKSRHLNQRLCSPEGPNPDPDNLGTDPKLWYKVTQIARDLVWGRINDTGGI